MKLPTRYKINRINLMKKIKFSDANHCGIFSHTIHQRGLESDEQTGIFEEFSFINIQNDQHTHSNVSKDILKQFSM